MPNALSTFLPDLRARGLLHQMTAPELEPLLARESLNAYIGFDPTGSSLHVGHLLQMMGLARLQRAGHQPIAVVGGGTGMIGDPSGKSAERNLLDRETLESNVRAIHGQLERFLDFSPKGGAKLVNNLEWLEKWNLLDFLREVGKHFSVGQMLARDSVKLRLDREGEGISYAEFSYGLLQAWDFVELFDRYGCRLQMGGSDQWGNLVDGIDLIRRLRSGQAYGLTQPLITKADGTKFGKTEAGAVWLDPRQTTPYEFFQYWFNVDDADAARYLRFFTFLPVDQIAQVEASHAKAPEKREAQRLLADEVTRNVHGEEARAASARATQILFGDADLASMSAPQLAEAFRLVPRSRVPRAKLGTPDGTFPALLADAQLVKSRSEARQAIQSGAATVNGRKIDDVNGTLAPADLIAGAFAVLRRGKKTFHVVEVVE